MGVSNARGGHVGGQPRVVSNKMVRFCAVVGCGNRSNRDKDKSFYRLPAVVTNQGAHTEELSDKRRRSWLAAIRRKDIKTSSYAYVRVCSDHFLSGKPSSLYDTRNTDWVPSLKLGHNNCSSADTSRHDRASARAVKRRKVQKAVDDDEEREVLKIEQEGEAVQDDNGEQSKEELQNKLDAELA